VAACTPPPGRRRLLRQSQPLPAASDGADDGSNARPAPTFAAVFLPRDEPCRRTIGLQAVVFAAGRNADPTAKPPQIGREFPGALHLHQMAFNVVACGKLQLRPHGEWRIQRGTESLSLLTVSESMLSNQPHCQRRPRRDRDFLRRREARSCRYRSAATGGGVIAATGAGSNRSKADGALRSRTWRRGFGARGLALFRPVQVHGTRRSSGACASLDGGGSRDRQMTVFNALAR